MTDRISIGFVPINENEDPYQPMLGTGWQSRKKPITVYKTMQMAEKLSPVKKAYEVFMEVL